MFWYKYSLNSGEVHIYTHSNEMHATFQLGMYKNAGYSVTIKFSYLIEYYWKVSCLYSSYAHRSFILMYSQNNATTAKKTVVLLFFFHV